MSRDEEVKDARLFDIRTVERNIKRGLINRKEYERFLKALPDATGNVAPPESEGAAAEPAEPRSQQ
jgi:hypothetical protein